MIKNPLTFERLGRSSATAFILAAVYAVLAWLWYALSISPVLMGLLVLVTLPAIFDLIANPKSEFSLDEQNLAWRHGRRNVSIPRHEIERMHIHLRMDRSIKLIVEMKNGRKIRVMQPAIPPLSILEGGFEEQEMPFQKHPFSLL